MTEEASVRKQARFFLEHEHLLTRDEALEALTVAESVLGEGVSRLLAAVAIDDRQVCREAAHALKGCLLNLGLTEPAALAQDLVQAALLDDASSRRDLAQRLAQTIAPFFPA